MSHDEGAQAAQDRPSIRVIIPDELPVLTPRAAAALLRLVRQVAARRQDGKALACTRRDSDSGDERKVG